MDKTEELLARADAIADGFMATALAELGSEAAALEGEVPALRGAFKTGWLMGYQTALEEVANAIGT